MSLDPQDATAHDAPSTTYLLMRWDVEEGQWNRERRNGIPEDAYEDLQEAMAGLGMLVSGWELHPDSEPAWLYSTCGCYAIKPVF